MRRTWKPLDINTRKRHASEISLESFYLTACHSSHNLRLAHVWNEIRVNTFTFQHLNTHINICTTWNNHFSRLYNLFGATRIALTPGDMWIVHQHEILVRAFFIWVWLVWLGLTAWPRSPLANTFKRAHGVFFFSSCRADKIQTGICVLTFFSLVVSRVFSLFACVSMSSSMVQRVYQRANTLTIIFFRCCCGSRMSVAMQPVCFVCVAGEQVSRLNFCFNVFRLA